MGCSSRVVVVGQDAVRLAAWARRAVTHLEQRWSRFLASSEITRLNLSNGALNVVSDETLLLVERSVEAWRETGGAFDPTVLPAVEAIGYDRDFAEVRDTVSPVGPRVPAPGCGSIDLFPSIPAVRLPVGVQFDPGGIGKGLAGDLVVAGLLERGAEGALVDLGGDLVFSGRPPEGDQWTIGVPDPFDPDREVIRFGLDGGAVATSSSRLRRWRSADGEVHHVIRPSTGACVEHPPASVTAVAGAGWWAEAAATMVMVEGSERGLSHVHDASILSIADDGSVSTTPDLEVAA